MSTSLGALSMAVQNLGIQSPRTATTSAVFWLEPLPLNNRNCFTALPTRRLGKPIIACNVLMSYPNDGIPLRERNSPFVATADNTDSRSPKSANDHSKRTPPKRLHSRRCQVYQFQDAATVRFRLSPRGTTHPIATLPIGIFSGSLKTHVPVGGDAGGQIISSTLFPPTSQWWRHFSRSRTPSTGGQPSASPPTRMERSSCDDRSSPCSRLDAPYYTVLHHNRRKSLQPALSLAQFSNGSEI